MSRITALHESLRFLCFQVALCQPSEFSSEDNPVLVDPSRKFKQLQVFKACSLIELIEDKYHLEFRPGCAFYEFTHKHEDIGPNKEVILMDKVSSFLHNNTILVYYYISK